MPSPLSPAAKRLMPLVDYTELGTGSTAADIAALAARAKSLPVAVAALCVRPAFVAPVKRDLAGTGIKVATVINFPDVHTTPEMAGANTDAASLAQHTRQAVADGADEIDLVFPWQSFQRGDVAGVSHVLDEVKEASGTAKLKVILESGAFGDDLKSLRAACDLAIDHGADMLKTSTGVYPAGATPQAFQVLADASKAVGGVVGLKVSGGVRTGEQAMQYVDIASRVLGLNWITPQNFRIGASKLVDNLITPIPAIGTPSAKAEY